MGLLTFGAAFAELSYPSAASSRADLAAKLRPLGHDLVDVIQVSDPETYCICTLDPMGNLWIGTAGTRDLQTALIDIEAMPLGSSLFPASVRLHAGFLASLEAVHDPLQAVIERIKPGALRFVGHSLGGAISTGLSAVLGDRRSTLCLTYGSPRIFSRAGAAWFDSLGVDSRRVVHDVDVVPRVPAVLGWEHVGGLLHLRDDGTKIGMGGRFWRWLIDQDREFVAVIDGRALLDHHVQTYIAICRRFEASLRV